MLQKAPKSPLGYFYEQRPLPADLPIELTEYTLKDKPITQLHSHQGLELGYCRSGSGVFLVDTKTLPFGPGDISIISEHEPHFAQARKDTQSDWFFMVVDIPKVLLSTGGETDLLDTRGLAGPKFNNILSADSAGTILSLILGIIEELQHQRQHYRKAVQGLLLTLMVELHRIKVKNPVPSAEVGTLQRLQPALDYICKHFDSTVKIERLAQCCAMSKRNFFRVFTQTLKRTPLECVNDFRIAMACAQLRSTDDSITKVALDNGFSTFSTFSRLFQKKTGSTPREWRKER